MQCPNCNLEAPAASFGDPLRCPDCGAFYEKALLLKAKKAEATAIPVIEASPGRVVAVASAVDRGLRAAVDLVTPAAKAHNHQGYFGKYYCPACGQVGDGERHVPGSILIELVLWLCFLVPGLIYSIWRHSASKRACGKCRSVGLIPSDSPRAKSELGMR